MQKVLFDISMSLDGLITEPNEGARHPLGEDPGRLHDWMFDRRTEADSEVLDECHAGTGAVVMGKRMFDVGAGPWGRPAALPQAGLRGHPRTARAAIQTRWYHLHLRQRRNRGGP
jgi:dihydrofolate reductase